MADPTLNILVIPTYNVQTMSVADISVYPTTPSAPTIEITVPGFGTATIPFIINNLNIYNSTSLGITSGTDPLQPLPDGVYYLKYTVAPAYTNFVNKTIIRVDRLQEKFDMAFMKLDMMECDLAIKRQAKVDLNSIYYFIQGAIAAANNCAVYEANKLYVTANKMLDDFIRNNCGCSGTNYTVNIT